VGNLGVKVFFVISGFLITTLLLKEYAVTGRVSLKGFYLRRVLRIFPAFYAYVAVILLLSAAGVVSVSTADILHAITYTANYHVDTFTATEHPKWAWEFNHLWSLAVEEQFYLIWPCLLVLLGPRRALAVASVVIIAVPICRYVMWYELGAIPTAMTRRFQAVGDALATGCLLAGCWNWLGANRWFARFLESPFAMGVGLGGLAASLGTAKLGMGVYYVFGQSVAHLSIALLIAHYVRCPQSVGGRVLNWPPVAAVGVLSYSLYLWQEPFLNPMIEPPPYYTIFPQNVVFAVAAAVLSYFLIERPFLRLKARSSASVKGVAT
jgi:peptidoglycan/LPS O-acetylase OafA/YrhL